MSEWKLHLAAMCGWFETAAEALGWTRDKSASAWAANDAARSFLADAAPETAPYSPPFTTDVPQCCGNPSSCDTPCTPEPAQEPVAWQYRRLDSVNPWIDCTKSMFDRASSNAEFETRALYVSPAPSDGPRETLALLDWERLRSGAIRALDPEHQPIFDRLLGDARDAARYRWLRMNRLWYYASQASRRTAVELDAAIDAAIAAEGKR